MTDSTETPHTSPPPIPKPPDPPTPSKSFADALKGKNFMNETQKTIPFSSLTPLATPTSYKGEKALFFKRKDTERMAGPLKYTLIGKFQETRPTIEGIRKVFATFDLKSNYHIGAIDKEHILIRLNCEEDYHRIWLRPNWYIFNYPMQIIKWTTEFYPSYESPIVPLWVSMPGVPYHMFDRQGLYTIASMLGKPMKLDMATTDQIRPSTARVCIEIDISKPLLRRAWLGNDDNSESAFYQHFIYEKEPIYCNICNKIGHICKEEKSAKGGEAKKNVYTEKMPQANSKTTAEEQTQNTKQANITRDKNGKLIINDSQEIPAVVKKSTNFVKPVKQYQKYHHKHFNSETQGEGSKVYRAKDVNPMKKAQEDQNIQRNARTNMETTQTGVQTKNPFETLNDLREEGDEDEKNKAVTPNMESDNITGGKSTNSSGKENNEKEENVKWDKTTDGEKIQTFDRPDMTQGEKPGINYDEVKVFTDEDSDSSDEEISMFSDGKGEEEELDTACNMDIVPETPESDHTEKVVEPFTPPAFKNQQAPINCNLWSKFIPNKVSFFMWRLLQHRIPVDDNMRRFGVQLPSKCYCSSEPAEDEHSSLRYIFRRSDKK